MSEQEHKTLGQVCFEEMWQAQHAATGASVLHWADVRPAVRLWWEAAAAAVKVAVLAEQAAPAEPQDMAEQEVRRTRIYGAAYGVLAGKMSWSTMERAIAQSVTDSILAALAEWEVTR